MHESAEYSPAIYKVGWTFPDGSDDSAVAEGWQTLNRALDDRLSRPLTAPTNARKVKRSLRNERNAGLSPRFLSVPTVPIVNGSVFQLSQPAP